MKPIVILGSGLAGYTAARELRKLDTATPLLIVTADDGRFYSKPLLSNAYAQGKDATTLAAATAAQMAAQLDARILTGTQATAIDPQAQVVHIGGKTQPYFKLVLAVGADPIRLPLAGDGAQDVLSVNSLADYGLFRSVAAGRQRVVIMGAGLIGCEFANDLRGAGFTVDVIDPAHWPLVRLLPEAAGRALRAGLAAAGVGWHLDTVVERIDRAGAAYSITLASGARLEADLVLSAVGLRPRTALAKAAGLDAARGVKVDRFLQASREAVYALGDCAEVEGLVLPYVMPIMHAGRALARTLAGQLTAARYPPMPVVVKTPAHPVVVAPPHPRASGQWRCEPAGQGTRCLFDGPGGRLLGFALTGEAVAEKQALTRELPPLLA